MESSNGPTEPVIACNIFFDPKEQLHKIYLSDPMVAESL